MRITPQDILNETVLVYRTQPGNQVRREQLKNLCELLDLDWEEVQRAAKETLYHEEPK